MYCRKCGAKIDDEAIICPSCGVATGVPFPEKNKLDPTREIVRKNPAISAILSFFVAGLGQIYNGEFGKGLVFILIEVIATIIMFTVQNVFLLVLFIPFWIYAIYDAYKVAKRIQIQYI